MKKRILSVLLVLAMILSMVPVSVTAAGTVTASPKAGTHATTGHTCEDCGATDWQPWPTSGTLPTEGHYYLTQNVEHTAMVEIKANEKLHLCLNGYVIEKTTTNRLFSASTAGAEFVLTDCTAYTDDDGVYHAGALTGGKNTGSAGGGAVFVSADAIMKMHDGIITGNQHKNDSKGGAAIALTNKSTTSETGGRFYMYGGEISNNQSYKGNGTSYAYGGAIYANKGAVVEISNAVLKDNVGNGGAIYAANAKISITNTLITGNTANNGGAIYSEGELNITDSTITGNTGASNNTTSGYSTAVLNAGSNSKMTISGKVVIADNTTYGSVPDVSFTKEASDVLYINDLTDGSRVVFATPASTVTNANEVIALNTKQTAAWQSGWVKWLSNITGTGELKDVGLVNGEFVWGHYHGDQAYTALTKAEQLTSGGHYYLASDLQLDKEASITTNVDVDLCLNGHTLTAPTGAAVLSTSKNSVVSNIVIDDCTAYTDDSGVYHAGSITGADHTNNGGVLYIRQNTVLDLYEGKLTNNKGGSGGAIIATGTVKMHGGEISNNEAGVEGNRKNGGAIYLNAGATFIMNGGTIKNNKSQQGGAVYMGLTATVELNGGVITGNDASSDGGAFYCRDTSIFKVSGKPQVVDNTVDGKANNLFMIGGSLIQLNNLDPEAKVGVTLKSGRDLAFTDVLSNDPSGSFSSDSDAYTVKLVNNKLTMVETTPNPPAPPVVQPHTHCVCGDMTCTKTEGIHRQVTFEAWGDTADETGVPTSGSYYLYADATVSATHTYAANSNTTLDLCLNGKTITQASGTSAQMYNSKAEAGVTITITDCAAKTDNGTYTAGKITGFVMDSTTEGSVMFLRKGTTLNIFEGIFTGNKTLRKSAGLMMINGVLNIYGGEFSNNQSGSNKEYNAAVFYLNTDSLAYISGATFKNNAGDDGGAIYSSRDNGHVIENTTFIGNSASGVGGAITVGNDGKVGFTIRNCTFTNNTAGEKGNAVRFAGIGRLENCVFTDNTGSEKGAVCVSNGATVTLAGSTTITGNGSNLYMEAQETVELDGFTGSAGVDLANTGRAFTSDCADLTANFTSDNAEYIVKHKDGKMWLVTALVHNHCVCNESGCTEHEVVEFQPWNKETTLPSSGSYCLTKDVTLKAEHTVKADLTICLNGHTITTSGKNRLLSTNGDVTLTITDCTAKVENGVYTAGKLTGGVETTKVGGGAVFVRKNGTLKLYDGILTGNQTLCDGAGGGAIMLQTSADSEYSAFYMYGGEISGNKACSADGTADRLGGGIYAYRNSVFVMEGGVIKNNEAGTGGGIYASNADLTLAGEISGNKATKAAGVDMESGTTVTVTGKATIVGNMSGSKASNLCLNGTKKIKVGALDASAKIAVSGTPLTYATEACSDFSANFLSDNSKYQIAYKEGALFLDAAGNHKHCKCAATSTYCDHQVLTFVEWDDPTKLPTSGNYYLSVDIELESQTTINNKELNLCLNGHTVKIVKKESRAFYTKGDATLRILDCTENPGKITGGTKGAIVTENEAESSAVIELWNGVMTGNENTAAGGAILIQGDTTLNMYGGKITGNKLECKVKTDKDGKPVLDEKGNEQTTSSHGGGGVAVYGANAEFHMYGGEISGNTTTMAVIKEDGVATNEGGFGAGVYAYKGDVYIHGGKIINNSTNRTGGGVFAYAGILEISGGEISGNTTEIGSGGGVYGSTDTVMNISGGSITNNFAGGGGGGLYGNTRAVITMTGGKITNNKSAKSGGAVMVSGKGAVMHVNGGEISGNYADGSAGGILIQSGATLNLNGVKINNNSCKGNGGGIYVSTNSFINMTNASVVNNHAKAGSGGLLIAANSVGKISGGAISYNSTDKQAGAARFNGATVVINGTRIVGNKSVGSGAGLMTNKASVKIDGVDVEKSVHLTLTNCYVAENVTEGAAGGLLFQSKGTVVNMSGCTVENNKADSSGAGMYVSTNVKLSAKNCKFLNNEGGAGGGFRLNNCTATMDNIFVSGNKGQGVVVAGANCDVTLNNMEICNNTHSSASGLQINSGATALVTNTRIYGNVAEITGAGMHLGNSTNVTLRDVDVFENKAENGGGFYAAAGNRTTMENVKFYKNTASALGGAIYTCGDVTMTKCSVTENASAGNGGGIHTWKVSSRVTADDGGLKMIDCEVSGNTAGGQGGGAYVFRGGPAVMTNTTFTNNTADQEGGGIYCDGRMDLVDVTITNNNSGGSGYALYLAPMEWDGHSYTTGHKSLAGNMLVKDNKGGDMYLAEGSTAAISGATLGDKGEIDVTLSDGSLTQRVIGVYHYEGEGLNYKLTAGNRSITEPIVLDKQTDAGDETPAGENILLYAGIGVFAVAVAAAAAIVVMKKKKAGKPAEKVSQE